MLLLGDILLEWGTEHDGRKLEEARGVYSTLIQLYGSTNVYLARMMRYFIRKDNLGEVLSLKNTFFNQKKLPLDAQDLLELSAYLLDKRYGPLLPAEEALLPYIEDVRNLLERAVKAAPSSPEAAYNYGRYFIFTQMPEYAKRILENALELSAASPLHNHKQILRDINTYRLLGELYFADGNIMRAQMFYSDGLAEFEREHEASGLAGTADVGALYSGMGDIEYFVSADMDAALDDYLRAVENDHDTPSVRYRIGYIQYSKENYADALGSFIKTIEEHSGDAHALFALANTLSMRRDNFAAEGYYNRVYDILQLRRSRMGLILPQTRPDQYELVDLYMKTTNNLGVALNRIARQNGDSERNARALAMLSESLLAYDALARNRETMLRPEGANLALQNISYMTNPFPDYEPGIYMDIPLVLEGEKIP